MDRFSRTKQILPQYPSTKSTIAQYMYDDPKLLGPHWEQPGRNIVAGLYKDIPWPEDKSGWNQETAQRSFYTGSPDGRELIMEKTVDWAALEGKKYIFVYVNGVSYTLQPTSRRFRPFTTSRQHIPRMQTRPLVT
jgi:hypothetical protein